jgi:hypothetical protein
MEKATRAEVIAALVTDKYSGFTTGDENLLETASDARLEEFRAASDNRRSNAAAFARLETEIKNTAARLKVAEDRVKEAEAEMSEDDFLARAPQSFKSILQTAKAEEDQTRAAIIGQLKDLGADTELELKKKSTGELKTLAKYARVTVPDFSGRAMPKDRTSDDMAENFAPPDPYADALKALRESKVTH